MHQPRFLLHNHSEAHPSVPLLHDEKILHLAATSLICAVSIVPRTVIVVLEVYIWMLLGVRLHKFHP